MTQEHRPPYPFPAPSCGTREAKPELLAPAGGPDAGYAALEEGADAVYLGLPRFSARAEAENFTPDQLADFVGYAHHLGRRVYATVNTLVQERELAELTDALETLRQLCVDAVIVQDLGVLRLIRQRFPELRLHASTQMAIHNVPGAKALLELGIKRVTLARELTLPEIAALCRIPGLEVETFLHGALCYSYSGLCLFSSLRLGRSANRGRCAYPCRDFFRTESCEKRLEGHAFSLKDLSLADHVGDLSRAGVASLKIEGRKKSHLYVSAVVRMYRHLIDQQLPPQKSPTFTEDLARVKTVFSRPLTDFFIGANGKTDAVDPDVVGHRGAETGTVQALAERGETKLLRFVTALPLERHDGLQIDLPEQSRPYGFGIDAMSARFGATWRTVFAAEPGQEVEIALPEDAPPLPAGATIYRASSQEVKRSLTFTQPKPSAFRQRIGLTVTATLRPGTLTVTGRIAPDAFPELSGLSAQVAEEGEWSPAREAGAMTQAVRAAFDKTGDTAFSLTGFVFENPDSLFVPISRLNGVRRALYDALGKLAEQAHARRRDELLRSITAEPLAAAAAGSGTVGDIDRPSPRWTIALAAPSQLASCSPSDLAPVDELVLDVAGKHAERIFAEEAALQAIAPHACIRFSLPALNREPEAAAFAETVAALVASGKSCWEVSNLWGWQLLRDANFARLLPLDLTAGWSLYSLNAHAIRQWNELGCCRCVTSPEDDRGNLLALLCRQPEQTEVLAYQDTPLLIGEACPRAALAGCSGNPERCEADAPSVWLDRAGASYRLRSIRCRTHLFYERPWSLSGHLHELPAQRLRADFTWSAETADTLAARWNSLRADEPIPHTHEGNFLRGLK